VDHPAFLPVERLDDAFHTIAEAALDRAVLAYAEALRDAR
jgi:hypothetical protein